MGLVPPKTFLLLLGTRDGPHGFHDGLLPTETGKPAAWVKGAAI
jgi:hypothetical protein